MTDNTPPEGGLDFANPDLQALLLSFKHVGELLRGNATGEQWAILTRVLAEEHTREQLANMLVGACTIHARSLTEPRPD